MVRCVAYEMSLPAQFGEPTVWTQVHFVAVALALGSKRRSAR